MRKAAGGMSSRVTVLFLACYFHAMYKASAFDVDLDDFFGRDSPNPVEVVTSVVNQTVSPPDKRACKGDCADARDATFANTTVWQYAPEVSVDGVGAFIWHDVNHVGSVNPFKRDNIRRKLAIQDPMYLEETSQEGKSGRRSVSEGYPGEKILSVSDLNA